MAQIGVAAFGTGMNFRVPDDADLSAFQIVSMSGRADVQEQLNDYLDNQGYNLDDSYK